MADKRNSDNRFSNSGNSNAGRKNQNGKQGQTGRQNSGNKQGQGSKQSPYGKQGQNSKQNQTGKPGQNSKQNQNSKPGQSSKQNRPGNSGRQTYNNPSAREQAYVDAPMKEQAYPVTEEEADTIRVTVDLDDGTTEECMILTIMTVGDQDYIALLPVDANDQPNAEGRVYLYRYFEDENDLPYMENIEDDDEYEAAFDAFDEWQDEMLFDSMD